MEETADSLAARAVSAREMTLNASTCLQFASPARQTIQATVVLCCFGRRRRLEGKSLHGFSGAGCVGARRQSVREEIFKAKQLTSLSCICFVFLFFSDADQSQIAVIKRDLFRVGYIASTQNLMRYQKVSAVGVTGQENEKPSRIRLHTQSFKQTTAAVGDGVGMLTIN